ncbi:MAG TPA: hypothetical protein EYP98_20875, partial [Planctomycetes bacterium]|nr:hypothetical protein [Planctomycetota bacterium]
YDKVKGSAVNPVLREGNSDRRAPAAVKAYARKFPHRMGKWSSESKSHVASMSGGDFFANEKSVTIGAATSVTIEHTAKDGTKTKLKGPLALEAGEIIDGTFLSKKALVAFLDEQVADAKQKGVLFSVHLKATMMKVSDPMLFGYAVEAFFKDVFTKHNTALAKVGADSRNGFGDLIAKIAGMPEAERTAVQATIDSCYANGPGVAKVNSELVGKLVNLASRTARFMKGQNLCEPYPDDRGLFASGATAGEEKLSDSLGKLRSPTALA